MFSSSSMLSSFDVDEMTIEALLFQTGYLTIKHRENLGGEFSKDTRNIEGFEVAHVAGSDAESLMNALDDAPPTINQKLKAAAKSYLISSDVSRS